MLNPIVFLAVFTFVVKVLGNPTPHYPVFLLSGLLAWNLFSVAVGNGTRSVIDNGNLVKKVVLPARDPAARRSSAWRWWTSCCSRPCCSCSCSRAGTGSTSRRCVLYPLSFVTLVVFTTAMVFWVSALNVRYRDVQHLIGLALLVWFWMTPIVYPGGLVQDKLTAATAPWSPASVDRVSAEPADADRLGVPAGAVRDGVARAASGCCPDVSVLWLVAVIGAVLVCSCLFFLYTWRLFFRLSGDFAEEL